VHRIAQDARFLEDLRRSQRPAETEWTEWRAAGTAAGSPQRNAVQGAPRSGIDCESVRSHVVWQFEESPTIAYRLIHRRTELPELSLWSPVNRIRSLEYVQAALGFADGTLVHAISLWIVQKCLRKLAGIAHALGFVGWRNTTYLEQERATDLAFVRRQRAALLVGRGEDY